MQLLARAVVLVAVIAVGIVSIISTGGGGGAPAGGGGSGDDVDTIEATIEQATELMQAAMGPLTDPEPSMLSLMTVHQQILDVPVVHDRSLLAGKTFILAQADGPYVLDDTRLQAPANGTRFILYVYGQNGLKEPLVETGFVDTSWTQDGDIVQVSVVAVAGNEIFLSFEGNGESHPVYLSPSESDGTNISLEEAASIEIAAKHLSVKGSIWIDGAELMFAYDRQSTLYIKGPDWAYEAREYTNEWHAYTGVGEARFWGNDFRSLDVSRDSVQESLFQLYTPNDRLTELTLDADIGFILNFEVRVDGDIVSEEFVERGSPFYDVAGNCFAHITFPSKNTAQKMVAPALYSLLVVL